MPDEFAPLSLEHLRTLSDPTRHGPLVVAMALELIELRKDKARLDWLLDDTNDAVADSIWDAAARICPVEASDVDDTGKWGRLAIDATHRSGEASR